MKKIYKTCLTLLSCALLAASPLSQMPPMAEVFPAATAAAEDAKITASGGWFETAYAEWDSNAIGSGVTVSYAPVGESEFVPVDAELIRGNRVDIPGLKGNTAYTVRIAGANGIAECNVTTLAYDRTGYAHQNFSDIGGYKDDGTLKPDVDVIYVTNENKDTITYNGKVGLYNIFFSAKPKNVVFRFVGKLDVPAGTVANDGTHNDGSNMLYLQNSSNVTIEGIGPDTDLNEWGIEMKRCTSCEVRNLWLGNYPDDAISMTGNADIHSEHIWVHNNTIEKGYNAYAGGGHVDADKADGDGSTDMKWSEFVTISYNVYNECHKTSLVGGKADQFQDHITYHHNWFNHTESRNPRVRNAHVHSYNNYFLANGEYGICASYNSKIFSDHNYFEQTKSPLYAINMGKDQYSGTIKSFGDVFDNCTPDEGLAYEIVTDRSASPAIPNLIDGGEGYDNFDLDLYAYTPQSPEDARETILALAGRMKADGAPIELPTEPVSETPTEEPTAPSEEPTAPSETPTELPTEEPTAPSEEPTEPVSETPTEEPTALLGDVDADGTIAVSDVILMQRYLLGSAELNDPAQADVCDDGVIDIFDLSMLKRTLLNQ